MQSNQHFNPANPAAAYGYTNTEHSAADIAGSRLMGAQGLDEAKCQQMAADNCQARFREAPTVTAFVEVRADRCFADALMHAMDGQRITRRGWNAQNQYVSAQYPDKGSKMCAPYLFLKNAQNELVPWVPSQGDLFAHDWAMLPRS